MRRSHPVALPTHLNRAGVPNPAITLCNWKPVKAALPPRRAQAAAEAGNADFDECFLKRARHATVRAERNGVRNLQDFNDFIDAHPLLQGVPDMRTKPGL